MSSISAAIIAKNESRSIIRCLDSLVPAVDEIIFVDTGSTDQTLELAKQFASVNPKVKCFEFEWCDDFSAARNFSLEQVNSDWVFVVDSDEFLFDEDVKKVKESIQRYSDPDIMYGLDVRFIDMRKGEISNVFSLMRIFRRSEKLFFGGIIHETITHPLKRESVDIRLIHDGYDHDQVDQIAKVQRNVTFLNRALQNDPSNAIYLMYFAFEISKIDLKKGFEYFAMARKNAKSKADLDFIEGYESQYVNQIKDEYYKENNLEE